MNPGYNGLPTNIKMEDGGLGPIGVKVTKNFFFYHIV